MFCSLRFLYKNTAVISVHASVGLKEKGGPWAHVFKHFVPGVVIWGWNGTLRRHRLAEAVSSSWVRLESL